MNFNDFIKTAAEQEKGNELLEKIAEVRTQKDTELLEKLAAFTQEIIAETAAVTTDYILSKLAEEGTSPVDNVAPKSENAEAKSSAPTTLAEVKETMKEVAKNPKADTVQGAQLVVAHALSKTPAPEEAAEEVVTAVHEAIEEAEAKGEVHPEEAKAAKTVATETAVQVVANS